MSIRADSALTTDSADAVQAAGGDVRRRRRTCRRRAAWSRPPRRRAARSWAPCRSGCRGRRRAPRPSRRRCRVTSTRCACAGQGLVHAVVDDLPQAVHEAAGVGGPDVHARDACGPPRAPRGRGGVRRCRCCRRSWCSCGVRWIRSAVRDRTYPRHAERAAQARLPGCAATSGSTRGRHHEADTIGLPIRRYATGHAQHASHSTAQIAHRMQQTSRGVGTAGRGRSP